MAIFLFLLALFLAVRSLVSLVLKRRDALHQMLVDHVKEAVAEQRKKLRILEFRKKKRKQEALEASRTEEEIANPTSTETDTLPAKAA